jgi:uncharacterized glyoxalase superfamily protein PhnB
VSENLKQAVPFFGVHDMERSFHFYADLLGFQKRWQWVDEGKLRWCWLERGGVAIMLQEFHHDRVPTPPLGTGMSINFVCEDAIALYHELCEKGLEPSLPFVGNHMWVTILTDPDGYKLDFESPTDAPEDSVYNPASS